MCPSNRLEKSAAAHLLLVNFKGIAICHLELKGEANVSYMRYDAKMRRRDARIPCRGLGKAASCTGRGRGLTVSGVSFG